MRPWYLLGLILVLGSLQVSGPSPYEFPKLLFFPPMPIASNNPVTNEGVNLGRHLFYDPILSLDSSISCSSCHQQAYAFSDPRQTAFSAGVQGRVGKRNAPPLFNLAWYPALFWDGRAVSIEEQVFHPVRAHEEMDLDWSTAVTRLQNNERYPPLFQKAFGSPTIDSQRVAYAIAQFERSLISNRSKYDRVLKGLDRFTADEKEGFLIMNEMSRGDCLKCHSTDADALGTVRRFSNNGLEAISDPINYTDKGLGETTGNLKDNGKFKIPSLRNIALTAPYMHDGRFKDLAAVLDFYSDQVHASANVDLKMASAQHGGVHLSAKEKAQVIAFLYTLTDSAFIQDPAFGNPFLQD